MLVELSVIPLGRGRSISADVADMIKIIDASGLDYRLTAAGTILEGSWEQVMDVARKCHGEMRKKTERVVTYMKIDELRGPQRTIDWCSGFGRGQSRQGREEVTVKNILGGATTLRSPSMSQ